MHPNKTGEIAMAPRITPAHLAIRNPVINKQEISFVDFGEIADAIGRHKSNRLFIELSGHVENTCNWMDNFSERYEKVADLLARKPSLMSELYVDAYPVFDSCQYVAWFSEAGFDGAIHAGSGETAGEAEYKVFSERQAMFAFSAEIPFLDETQEKMDQA